MSWLYRGCAARQALFLCAFGSALAASGCANVPAFDTSDVAPRRVFAVGLENLSERYVDPVRLSDVTLAGLNNLSTIDSAIQVEESRGSLRLLSRKQVIAEWKVPRSEERRVGKECRL